MILFYILLIKSEILFIFFDKCHNLTFNKIIIISGLSKILIKIITLGFETIFPTLRYTMQTYL